MHPADQLYPSNTGKRPYGFRKSCEAVKEAVPLEEVASRYTRLRRAGERHVGLCPLHTETRPSFTVYPNGRYHCYGCGAHGDAIDLHFHCGDFGELWEALVDLSIEYGVELPERPQSWHRRQVRQRPVRDGIEAAKVHVARRRLYKRFFDPLVRASTNEEDRAHDAQLFWEMTTPLAEHLIANMMERER
jgi:DNA primase